MMADRAFLSIGEVLNLLKEEFPDITISKIRFLESQGLLDPERTASGYRKFYDADVERLRWILRQQREHFLPLKVIKGKLGADAVGEGAEEAVRVEGVASRSPAATGAVLGRAPSGASMTGEELCRASGLSSDELAQLERFGLVAAGRSVGGMPYYDEDALLVASLAAGCMKFGVEPRHLRMYRTAAEREAGFFEQLVLPMLKQRNPESRQQAVETIEELSRLGEGLRRAMLRLALRGYLE